MEAKKKRAIDRDYIHESKRPVPKKKLIYKICPHCNKELNIKIYKEHERLYYDATKGIWSQDVDSDNEGLISDFSSPGESDYDTDPTEKEILGEYSSESFTDELCNNDDVALQQQENASQGT